MSVSVPSLAQISEQQFGGILGWVVGRDIFSAILAKFRGDLGPEEGSRGEGGFGGGPEGGWSWRGSGPGGGRPGLERPAKGGTAFGGPALAVQVESPNFFSPGQKCRFSCLLLRFLWNSHKRAQMCIFGKPQPFKNIIKTQRENSSGTNENRNPKFSWKAVWEAWPNLGEHLS